LQQKQIGIGICRHEALIWDLHIAILREPKDKKMIGTPDNDNNFDGPMIFIIIGKGYESDTSEGVDLHVMLKAADDDSAVREALNALAEEGFIEADLDQIGMLTEVPSDEPHASAYQGALDGEVSIIRFS
jgi:hypothetical protein